MGKVLLMGVGGAGMAITKHVEEQLGYPAIAVNTNAEALKQSGFRNTLQLGTEICQGVPAKLPAVAGLAAEQSGDQLRSVLRGYDTVVVIAGLGGGTGTGATPIIVDLAQSQRVEVISVVVLPFEFETARREAACRLVSDLRSMCNRLLVYDNAKMSEPVEYRHLSVETFFALQTQRITGDIRSCLQSRIQQ